MINNSRIAVVILITGGVLLILFALWQYLFSIYEVSFKVTSTVLYADSKSVTSISAVPLNALGFRAPLRSSPAEFEIIEGKDLIDIVKIDPSEGLITIRSRQQAGKVVIKIRSKSSLMPSIVEIVIQPTVA